MEAESEPFAPIRPESTSERIARTLRDALARGHFRPGQQLIEADLAGSFHVSRGVIREAAQRLAQEGLLVSRPNRGVFVAEFGPDEVYDIYSARLAIERAAGRRAGAGSADRARELAEALDALTDRLEERAAAGADADELVRLELAFQERLVAEAASPRLSRMYETLATETRMCLAAFDGEVYPFDERVAEHRAIARAIAERRAELLHRLLGEHADRAIEAIVRASAPAAE